MTLVKFATNCLTYIVDSYLSVYRLYNELLEVKLTIKASITITYFIRLFEV